MNKLISQTFLFLLLTLFTFSIQAQYIGFASLFKPGARVGIQYMPTNLLDNEGQFGYSQLRTTLIIPLSGSANLDLKKLKASAKQYFITANWGIRQYELGTLNFEQEIANFSVGFTGMNASLGSGIWVYSIHAGFLQNLNTNSKRNPFVMAGGMKVKIKGLNRQDFFGGGVVYAGKQLLPVPLIGLRRKLAKKLHITALFPVQLDITKKFSKTTRLSWLSTVSGFSSLLEVSANGMNQDGLFSFGSFRSSLIVQLRFSRSLKLFVEGGMNLFGKTQVYDDSRETKLLDYNTHFTPYAGLTARFNFGKSILGSQMFGNDL